MEVLEILHIAQETDIAQILAIIDEINHRLTYNFFRDIILVFIIVGVILLTVELTGFIIRVRFRKSKLFPHEVISGFLNIMRVIAIFIMIISILVFFGIMDYDTLLNFSTILSTAIGLASAIIIGNLIAGFYMIGSQPYDIGDYIKMDNIEGFVKEIGLNYTTITDRVNNVYKIPNKVAFDANIINYDTFYSSSKPEEDSELEKLHEIKNFLKDFIYRKEISKYFFEMELEFDRNSHEIVKLLDDICEKWISKFGYKPQIFYNMISWRLIVKVLIISTDMKNTMRLLPQFLDNIWDAFYSGGGE